MGAADQTGRFQLRQRLRAPLFPLDFQLSRPLPEELPEERQGLGHGHRYLLDEAGQVDVPFRQARTLVGAQGDVHLEQTRVGAAGSTASACEQRSPQLGGSAAPRAPDAGALPVAPHRRCTVPMKYGPPPARL